MAVSVEDVWRWWWRWIERACCLSPKKPPGRSVVAQEVNRMVAHLFELHQSGQNQALPLDALDVVDRSAGLLDYGGIQRRLLAHQVAKDLHLQLGRHL